jgi:hypothetical protein
MFDLGDDDDLPPMQADVVVPTITAKQIAARLAVTAAKDRTSQEAKLKLTKIDEACERIEKRGLPEDVDDERLHLAVLSLAVLYSQYFTTTDYSPGKNLSGFDNVGVPKRLRKKSK